MGFGGKVDLNRSHSLSMEKVRLCAEEIAEEMKRKYSIDWKWENNSIVFRSNSGAAKGISGKLDITSSKVNILIHLPILLYALRDQVEKSVNEKFVELFG
jgi:putative polyhydroxyalkanoate system protein